jgi:hypothetical protein
VGTKRIVRTRINKHAARRWQWGAGGKKSDMGMMGRKFQFARETNDENQDENVTLAFEPREGEDGEFESE